MIKLATQLFSREWTCEKGGRGLAVATLYVVVILAVKGPLSCSGGSLQGENLFFIDAQWELKFLDFIRELINPVD